ncbi:MAG: hypothetical protein K6F32_05925, partial [Bacilli bacterium]|nr:hypothetical protein [Bacilli bacterium]
MSEKRKKREYTRDHTLSALGALLMLIAAMLFLAPYSALSPLSYVFVYPFGLIGYYLFQGAIGVFGFFLLFHKLIGMPKKRFDFGFLLIAIGLGVLLSAGFNVAPGSYAETYKEALPHVYGASSLGGGIVFTYLASALSSIGAWLAYVVGGVLAALGAFLYITPLLKKGPELIVTPASDLPEDDGTIAPEDEDDSFLKSEEFQKSAIAQKQEPKKPEPEEKSNDGDSPLSHFNFTPAGRMDLPTRSARYQASEEPKAEERPAARPVDDLAPKAVPNPSPSLYRNNPVRVSGLQEAIFNPDGLEEN